MSDFINDFKSNSHKSKERKTDLSESKRTEKIVSNPVKTKKKSEVRKLADIFISEDAANVKSYIIWDVLVPTIKKAVSEIIKNGSDIVIFGEKKRDNSSGRSKVSYGGFYDKGSETRMSYETRERTRFDYENIVINTRAEAEEVLDEMQDLIVRYGVVRISDLYDMVELTAPYTGNRYGWTTIQGAKPIRVDDGYILKLPRPRPID